MIIIISIIGTMLSTNEFFLPLHITSAFMSMPFFYAGSIIRSMPSLYQKNKSINQDIAIFAVLTIPVVAVAYFLNWPDINMYSCQATLRDTFAYIPLSIIMVIGFLHLCKAIKRIPIISYMGRYSIIILGIHNIMLGLIINLMKSLTGIDSQWPGTIVTLALCIVAIPICRHYFPYVTAQKELLTPLYQHHINNKSL